MTLPPDHPTISRPRIGVLIVNLGTPDAPDAGAVRRYLGQFLSDRRVVEIPPLLWQPILRGIILTTRPKKSAHAYAQVWRADGSPLAAITAAQAGAMKGAFGDDVLVDHAMRYGSPAIADRLAALKAAGCERILIAPLYPQYCAATTATANDDAFAALATMRWQPAIRTLPPYYDDPHYIDALKTSVEASLAALPFVPDAILASFHGMPARTLALGDPYHCHCQKTARLLSEALGRELTITFQSRFGRAKWLEPRPTSRWRRSRPRASSALQSSRRASRQTAWRRWKSWRSAAAKPSWRPAEPTSLICPVSMPTHRALICCIFCCAGSLRAGSRVHRLKSNRGE
jgi:ferrochelatase